jgi:probable F420-dependent oxidoreductase
LGYSALWIPEGYGRNPLVLSSWLLANTKSLIVATGIANLYARDAMAMAAARTGLNEQSDGRFLLGIGVSNAKIVSGTRGHEYGKPLGTMRAYLDSMAQAPYLASPPPEMPVTVIAALREKMMALAAELTDGAHTFNVTPDHTARARTILGPEKLLCVEQKLVLETSPSEARAIGRRAVGNYLRLEPYRNSMKEMGFTDDDMANGGSDRLVDALVAWGDETALRQRIQSHLGAGATQLCINPVAADGGIDMRIVKMLAPNGND